MASLRGKVGDIVKVGDVIVVIDDGAGARPRRRRRSEVAATRSGAGRRVPAAPRPPAPAARRRPVPAAPATRRLARELKVDINLVPPTGPAGRVTPEDVHRFAAGGGAAPAPAPRR